MIIKAMLGWNERAKTHLIEVDEEHEPITKKAMCGMKMPWSEIWECKDSVTCKKCKKIEVK